MSTPTGDWTDEQLLEWFVADLDRPHQPARRVGEGVVEIDVLLDEDEGMRTVELLLTGEQLRELVSVEPSDEVVEPGGVDGDARPPDVHPVAFMLGQLLDDLEETLATLSRGERYVVLDGFGFAGSTRSELPPVPGTSYVEMPPGTRGFWSAFPPDHPRFGEPGSLLGDSPEDGQS